MRSASIITWFLAISMFMFGILKLVDPFKGWYELQVANSGLGEISYFMGILGEISIGTSLILALLFRERIGVRVFQLVTITAYFAIIIMMGTATFVHLHPEVPADVLPLKIKPPIIPMVFLTMSLIVSIRSLRQLEPRVAGVKK